MLKRQEESKWIVVAREVKRRRSQHPFFSVSLAWRSAFWQNVRYPLHTGNPADTHKKTHTQTSGQVKAERQTLRGFSRQRAFSESEANREAQTWLLLDTIIPTAVSDLFWPHVGQKEEEEEWKRKEGRQRHFLTQGPIIRQCLPGFRPCPHRAPQMQSDSFWGGGLDFTTRDFTCTSIGNENSYYRPHADTHMKIKGAKYDEACRIYFSIFLLIYLLLFCLVVHVLLPK